MANVSIGGITLSLNPAEMTLIKPDKPTAVKKTHEGVAYFSWPASIVGKIIDLTWDQMQGNEFASLDALYVADNPVVFNPNDGKGKIFSCNILSLDGKYLLGLDDTSDSYREQVKMSLLIMSEL